LAGLVLLLLYVLIIAELMHQTLAAMMCAFLGLSCLALVHDRPSMDVVSRREKGGSREGRRDGREEKGNRREECTKLW
jgi:hypothetical protein